MLRQDGSGQKISEFVELIKEWEMHFYVPNDSVRIICYEMGEDHTDSRMAGQITEEPIWPMQSHTGLSNISTDTLIKSCQPARINQIRIQDYGPRAPFSSGRHRPPHITIHFHPEIFFMPGECQPRRCMQSVTVAVVCVSRRAADAVRHDGWYMQPATRFRRLPFLNGQFSTWP